MSELIKFVDGFKPSEQGYYGYEVGATGCKIVLHLDSCLCVTDNFQFNDTHVSRLDGRFTRRIVFK